MSLSMLKCFMVLSLPVFGQCGIRDWIETPTEAPEVAVEKWRHLEDQMRTGVDALLRQLMPALVRSTSDLDISPECLGSLLKLISGVRNFQDWAIRMLDAAGKPEGGQLLGTVSALGSYDECLDITVPEDSGSNADLIRGMYCVLDIRVPLPPKPKLIIVTKEEASVLKEYNTTMEVIEKAKKILGLGYSGGFKLGVCLPSRCSKDDLHQVVKVVTDRLGVLTRVRSCEVKQDQIQLDTVQWVVVFTLAIFVLLVTSASVVHYFMFFEEDRKPSVLQKVVLNFSAISNFRILMDTSEGKGDQSLACLNGLRFYSMTWVLLAHANILADFNVQRNLLLRLPVLKSFAYQALANGFLAVDTFFFITAVLVSNNLSSSRKCNVPVAIIRRIWRLLPSAMLVAGLSILLPALGSGPFWTELLEDNANNCRQYWWRIALFINNYFDLLDMCLGHTWYLGVDMQLFLVALVFILIYLRKQRAGNVFLVFLVAGSIVSTTLTAWYMELTPLNLIAVLESGMMRRVSRYVYQMPSAHLGVYALGLAVGAYLANKEKLVISWWSLLVGWMAAIACSMTALYTTVIWNNGSSYPIGWGPALYGGLHRPLWTLGLAWLTVTCARGHGGLINSFLSGKVYVPLNRLTYLVYLLHVLVISYYQASLRGNSDSTQITFVYLFFGYMGISFGLALFVKLFFEYPLILLENQLFQYLQKPLVKEVGERKEFFENEVQDVKCTIFPSCDIITRM